MQARDWLFYALFVGLLLAYAHQRAKATQYARLLRALAIRQGLPANTYLPNEPATLL